jgi:hypothetical protein
LLREGLRLLREAVLPPDQALLRSGLWREGLRLLREAGLLCEASLLREASLL